MSARSASSPEVVNPVVEAMSVARSAKTSTKTASAQVRNGLSRTREKFTDTMEALPQKVDMPSGVKDTWHAAKDTAQATLGKATRQLREGKKTVQGKATEVGQQAKDLTNQAAAQIPEPVAEPAAGLAQAVRQRPVSAVAMVFVVFVVLLLRRLLSRTTG